MNNIKERAGVWFLILALALLISSPLVFTQTKNATPPQAFWRIATSSDSDKVEFAAIGDFGAAATGYADSEKLVAKMVKNWNPGFIITLGDNNYKDGAAETIVQNIGKYYCGYIYNKDAPDKQRCEGWANDHKTNLFFPTLGNHDWYTSKAQPYIDYFTQLPSSDQGKTRYYDFVQGPVHFFALDSESIEACEEDWCEGESPCADCEKPGQHYEPDGAGPDSTQAEWLKKALKASTSPWNIVYFHHTPYTCKNSSKWMRWDFKKWGANAVIAGHKHRYERGWVKGDSDFPYFTNGVGGTKLSECDPDDCSKKFEEVIFQNIYGAMWVKAKPDEIRFEFYEAREGKSEKLLDRCMLTKSGSGQKLSCEVMDKNKAEHCPE